MIRKLMLLLITLMIVVPVAAQEASTTVDSRTGTAYGVAWNPDGTIMAVASGYEITLFSADLETVLAVSAEEDAQALDLAWSPDGTQIASVGGYNRPTIRVWDWDADAGTMTLAFELDGGVHTIDRADRARHQYGIEWHEDRLLTLINDQNSRFQMWNIENRTLLATFRTNYIAPKRELIIADNLLYAVGIDDGHLDMLYTLDLETEAVTPIIYFSEPITTFTLLPDQNQVVVGYADGRVEVVDLNSGESVREFTTFSDPVSFDWHESSLAVLGYETQLGVWVMEFE